MPTERGFKPPPVVPTISRAAARLRAAAVAAAPRDVMLPVQPRGAVDQRDVQCCVSCALAGAMEMRHADWPALAPLFHYHVTRFMHGAALGDGRLPIDDALVTLTNEGICRRADHPAPFTDAGAATPPSAAAFADGLARRLDSNPFDLGYERLSMLTPAESIRDAVSRGRPVVVGLFLPAGYPGGVLGARHEWSDPASPPRTEFGHCVLVTGFRDSRQAFRVLDSQGPGRFDQGRWWLGYRVADSGVVADAYALT